MKEGACLSLFLFPLFCHLPPFIVLPVRCAFSFLFRSFLIFLGGARLLWACFVPFPFLISLCLPTLSRLPPLV